MCDLDERVERVIAEVTSPEERIRVKRAIREGYLEATWDEATGAPRFVPTDKMLESIRERNNDGLA